MRLRTWLLSWWDKVRSSYWFVPSLMAAGAAGLSWIMLTIDHALPADWLTGVGFLYTGSAQGARQLLSTIAQSMIGLAGVVFSITIVALVLASNQFGPRLLRNFMRDLANQIVLGTFVANFLYCLLILRTIHGADESNHITQFIPQVSMIVAVLLSVFGLGVLIYFIHHTARQIQAPNVIAAVAEDLHAALDAMYPDEVGRGPAGVPEPGVEQVPEDFDAQAAPVWAQAEGYVQRVESSSLLAVARARDMIVWVRSRPGSFVRPGIAVAHVWPAARVDDAVRRDIWSTFSLGSQRTIRQNAVFAVDQLVEIAVRALSPSLNDPSTARQCLQRLESALCHLARRRIPTPYRLDDRGRLRVIAFPLDFFAMARRALDEIRRYAASAPSVLAEMMAALGRIGAQTDDESIRRLLVEHLDRTYALARDAVTSQPEQEWIHATYDGALEAMRLVVKDE